MISKSLVSVEAVKWLFIRSLNNIFVCSFHPSVELANNHYSISPYTYENVIVVTLGFRDRFYTIKNVEPNNRIELLSSRYKGVALAIELIGQ